MTQVYDPRTIEAACTYCGNPWIPSSDGRCGVCARDGMPQMPPRALPVSSVPTPSDAIGETVEKLREALCRAAEFLDAAAGEDIEIDGMAAIGIVEELHDLLPDDGRDRCFHEAVRLHLPTLLTALEQRVDGWLLPKSAGPCAYDRDECTVTIAFDNEDEVLSIIKTIPSRNRVRLVDDEPSTTLPMKED